MSASNDDDAVGYKRPPKGTRWKKGQCGNSGRKRGRAVKGDRDIIDELLAKSMKVVENGSTRRMTGLAVIMTQLLKKESAGQQRATSVLHKYLTAFPPRQTASRDILLISNPDSRQQQSDETPAGGEGK